MSVFQQNTASTTQPDYIIGVDLGTTNSVLAYQKCGAANDQVVAVLAIPQLQAAGATEKKSQLPSFVYLPAQQEFQADQLQLPWSTVAGVQSQQALAQLTHEQPVITGEYARRLGIKTPKRWIASAKSWLCQGADLRNDPAQEGQTQPLPLDPAQDIRPLSALAVTELFLRHLQAAWEAEYPDHTFSDQRLVVTIPASFDPLARELTASAIRALGVSDFTLVEEPQSALYAWLGRTPDWRDRLQVNDTLLVVDVGGGTTDFSLISVSEKAGDLTLERTAVGNHILLGGDNMDLALAYGVRQQLEQSGKRLESWQMTALTQSCRQAKEALLNDLTLEQAPVTVPGRGSSLLGKTLRAQLSRELLTQILLEGFFPACQLQDSPQQAPRSAVRARGLPYAQDAAITRHLSGFLSRHLTSNHAMANDQIAQPNLAASLPGKLLLNGGVFQSTQLVDRLVGVINSWYCESDKPSIELLNPSATSQSQAIELDLGVAKGAVFFGQNQQSGVRIRSGLANSYYIGIESSMPAVPGFTPPLEAVCIAPFGMEAGARVSLPDRIFQLLVGQPVQFRFFGSSSRSSDQVGDVLEYWTPNELTELPIIEAVLPTEETADDTSARQDAQYAIAVTLAAHATEVGTLELSAQALTGAQSWQISLDVALKG